MSTHQQRTTKKLVVFALLLSLPMVSDAQTLTVYKASNSYLNDKTLLRRNDSVEVKNNSVTVRPGGSVIAGIATDRTFSLPPGTYKLDSCYQAVLSPYITHDSILQVLKEKGLLNCRFPYPLRCVVSTPTGIPDTTSGRIITGYAYPDNIISAKDTFRLHWKNPKPYSGTYYIVGKTMFDEYVYMEETSETNYLIRRTAMHGRESDMLVRIIAGDCRESRDVIIYFK